MKKILIMSHSLEIGGAERSLIGLLNAIDPAQYDVDLFLLRHEGELMQYIPKYVNVLPQISSYTVLARPIKDVIREGHFLLAGARCVAKFLAKKYIKKHKYTDRSVELEYSHKFICKFMPNIDSQKEYDLAISFLTPHYFLANKVRAKKKLAWIHTDYSVIQVDVDSELAMWDKYDYIASISDSVTTSFLKTFPSLSRKIVLIENIISSDFIQSKANEFSVKDEMNCQGIKLLSIGRFCEAKNFDNVPDICKRLVDSGLNVYWYLIGFGCDEKLIRQRIKDAGMESRVIILGKKENPYPYIKYCDLYVQPSRYEGKSVTIREAQILNKPVVITNYSTASSQLVDGFDGVIVPMNNEDCAKGIANLLKDETMKNKISENCKKTDYTNSQYIDELYKLI